MLLLFAALSAAACESSLPKGSSDLATAPPPFRSGDDRRPPTTSPEEDRGLLEFENRRTFSEWRIAGREGCALSLRCLRFGKCSDSAEYGCVSATASDCLFSQLVNVKMLKVDSEQRRCVPGGAEAHEFYRSVRHANPYDPVEKVGDLCSNEDPVCPGDSLYACRFSYWCVYFGKCFFNGTGCVALADSGCRISVGCKDDGRCAYRDGICVLGGEGKLQTIPHPDAPQDKPGGGEDG